MRRGDNGTWRRGGRQGRETVRGGEEAGNVQRRTSNMERSTGNGEAADLKLETVNSKRARSAMRAKRPVPKGAVWWNRAEGHPCLRFFGAELRHQRWDVRGWSLEDLHQASGLCRSFLCELENGKAAPTEEAILELEAALEMEIGGLMELVKRRWMRWVSDQGQRSGLSGWLGTQARHIRRALKRRALAEWLGAWLALPEGFWSLEPVLES